MSLQLIKEARAIACPWGEQYNTILHQVDEAQYVLIGEMSHGTHEFYKIRADLTKKLIEEKDFHAVAVEADWPDALRVNRYVRGASNDRTASQALADFQRFPQWMWRNADVLDFIGWLRAHNDQLSPGKEKIGFYGLDLYSLNTSVSSVLRYLEKVDPEAAKRAQYRYGCFDHFGEDAQAYGYAAQFNLSPSCEEEVLRQLLEIRKRAAEYAQMDGRVASDEYFFAEQNARVIKNAENYYRAMFGGKVASWNLRDSHMMETLLELRRYLTSTGLKKPRIVVWAHNSHLWDARATEMGQSGELNLGQLAREHFGDRAVLIGFSTYTGSVTAASSWDAPAERKLVHPSLAESYEAAFHQLHLPRVLFTFNNRKTTLEEFLQPHLQRAIGVIYVPQTERLSHYFHAVLPEQFDVMLHIDETRAVEPLEPAPIWRTEEPSETYPTGY